MISVKFDPLGKVIQVVHDFYPDAVAEVVWCEGLREERGAWGATSFDEADVPLIYMDVQTPMVGAVEVLAHELAHVVAGHEAGHGPEWERVFSAIHEEYVRRQQQVAA